MAFQLYSRTLLEWAGSLVAVLFLSILAKALRNICLHPLSSYPGPKLLAATSLVNSYYVLRGQRAYKISELHNLYGPVVRVAPNELSYVDQRAWKDIYGPQKGQRQLEKHTRRGPKDVPGLFDNPSDEEHARIRKIVALGFSEKAVRENEGVLQGYVDVVIKRLKESENKQTDLVRWFKCVAGDVVGHFTFGHGLGGLETSTIPPVVHQADFTVKGLALNLIWNQYWFSKTLKELLLGNIIEAVRKFFQEFVMKNLERRGKRLAQADSHDADSKDLISLLGLNSGTEKGLSSQQIGSVAVDLMLAGSDTTATAISAAIYLLLTNPAKLKLLNDEIRSAFRKEKDMTLTALQTQKYLNAVLSDTMRLFPAAPETTRRLTNKGGNLVCGRFIPGNVLVGVYHYAAGHNSSSFRNASSFVPERWLGDPEYASDDRGVLSFFQFGPRNCVGQTLAMAQMRLLLARVIWNFDMELCEESRDWMNIRAYILSYEKKPLMVKLKPVR